MARTGLGLRGAEQAVLLLLFLACLSLLFTRLAEFGLRHVVVVRAGVLGALVLGEQLLHEFRDLELEIDRLDVAVNVRDRFGAENVAVDGHRATLFVDFCLILFEPLLQVLFGQVQIIDFFGQIFVALEQFDARETCANEISHQHLELEQQHSFFARVEVATRGQETFAPLAELRINFEQNVFELFELVVREYVQHEVDEELIARVRGASSAVECSTLIGCCLCRELVTVAEHVATRVFEQLMAQPEREQVIRCAVVLQVIAARGVKEECVILIKLGNIPN